jgi:hypothetical protein
MIAMYMITQRRRPKSGRFALAHIWQNRPDMGHPI